MWALVIATLCVGILQDSNTDNSVPAAPQVAEETTELGIRCEVVVEKTGAVLRTLETRIEPNGEFLLQATYPPQWCRIQGTVTQDEGARKKLLLKYRFGECVRIDETNPKAVEPDQWMSKAEQLPVYRLLSNQFVDAEREFASGTPIRLHIDKSREALVVSLVQLKASDKADNEQSAECRVVRIRKLDIQRNIRRNLSREIDSSRMIETLIGRDNRFQTSVTWDGLQQQAAGETDCHQPGKSRCKIKCSTDKDGQGITCDTSLTISTGSEILTGWFCTNSDSGEQNMCAVWQLVNNYDPDEF